ncbi:hypothetical protein MLD38_031474 [Melastoma candidum]|uniref:Uncharacterized protein n=1 Tax=Melastoma candidum TaxID=119954 RepID=A0ACB9MT87_9MYRT|nr:hypothetical protein MLD38_031474 [Melastoma candidum]
MKELTVLQRGGRSNSSKKLTNFLGAWRTFFILSKGDKGGSRSHRPPSLVPCPSSGFSTCIAAHNSQLHLSSHQGSEPPRHLLQSPHQGTHPKMVQPFSREDQHLQGECLVVGAEKISATKLHSINLPQGLLTASASPSNISLPRLHLLILVLVNPQQPPVSDIPESLQQTHFPVPSVTRSSPVLLTFQCLTMRQQPSLMVFQQPAGLLPFRRSRQSRLFLQHHPCPASSTLLQRWWLHLLRHPCFLMANPEPGGNGTSLLQLQPPQPTTVSIAVHPAFSDPAMTESHPAPATPAPRQPRSTLTDPMPSRRGLLQIWLSTGSLATSPSFVFPGVSSPRNSDPPLPRPRTSCAHGDPRSPRATDPQRRLPLLDGDPPGSCGGRPPSASSLFAFHSRQKLPAVSKTSSPR